MTTIVFPGQGSQYVGMCKDFYDNFNIARETLEEIEDYTTINLKDLLFEDKNQLLNLTNYTQISIFTASLMIFRTLEHNNYLNLNKINFMLGHSLGEYTALACSKKLTLKECSLILKKRGELMNSAVTPNETGMAALIGSDSNKIEDIIKKNNINLEVGNDNSPMQVVVSGNSNDIESSKQIFLKNNVKKFIKLNVSAAFHSKYMKDAQIKLEAEISKLNFKENKINIISNYSSFSSNNNSEIIDSLKNQMANKVKWTESIKNLEKNGEIKIIEIGPNKVLSGLINRISKSFDIRSFTTVSDLNII